MRRSLVVIQFVFCGLCLFACTNGVLTSEGGGAAPLRSFKNALLYDGINDSIAVAHTSINIVQPLTIEMFIKPNSIGGPQFLFRVDNTGLEFFRLSILASGQVSLVTVNPGCGGAGTLTTPASVIAAGVKYHVAAVWRSDGFKKIYVNGIEVGSTGPSTVAGCASDLSSTIGTVGAASYFDGIMDELRLSKTERYLTAFTPPIEPFEPDSDTLLLLHFDTGSLTDYSQISAVLTFQNGLSSTPSIFP